MQAIVYEIDTICNAAWSHVFYEIMFVIPPLKIATIGKTISNLPKSKIPAQVKL